MAGDDRRIAASLLVVIAFLIVYGSLYPFSFAASGADPAGFVRRLTFAGSTRSDVAANVLLYVPLGACIAWLALDRLGATVAVVLATLAGALLSFGIEFAQLYETRRVTSLADFASNAVGAFLGGWIAVAIAARRRRASSPVAALLAHPVAAALLLSWLGYRLAPFAPVLDPAKWAASFAALAGDWLDGAGFLRHLVAWLVLREIASALAPQRTLAVVAGAMAVVLAGRVLLAGIVLEPAEVAGMAGALLLAPGLARQAPPRRAGVLAMGLAASMAIDGLVPFDFRIPQDRLELLPFAESLTHYRATNLAEMFLRCFLCGGLVWLLARAGLTVLAATGAAAGFAFSIEFLQTWLPGRTAEITDPLLAIAAGGLVAVFEPDRPG